MKIQIRGIREETSQAGKQYWKLETDKGDMSCFEQNVVNKLCEAWQQNKAIEVNTKASEDGKYVNIRGIGVYKEDYAKPVEVVKPENVHTNSTYKRKEFDKDPVGLATDIVCAGKFTPNEAEAIVKKFQKAFS